MKFGRVPTTDRILRRWPQRQDRDEPDRPRVAVRVAASLPAMKQVVLRDGAPQVVDVPAPGPTAGARARRERRVGDLQRHRAHGRRRGGGGGSLPMRAIRNPDLVRKTLKHAREHGMRETVELVRGAAATDSPLGYSSAGIVLDTGGIADFRVGQLVACAGAGQREPRRGRLGPGQPRLRRPGRRRAATPRVRDDRRDRAAGRAPRRADARRARRRRRARPARAAHGPDPARGRLPRRRRRAGRAPPRARRPSSAPSAWSRPTRRRPQSTRWSAASAPTPSIVTRPASRRRDRQRRRRAWCAARAASCRSATSGSAFERDALYQREADVLISTSYGPGRYDPTYEEAGVDYPLAYVRWTENRNMEEFLRLLATGDVARRAARRARAAGRPRGARRTRRSPAPSRRWPPC